MHDDMTTVLTVRGQTSVPATLRRLAHLKPGQRLRWRQMSNTEFAVRIDAGTDAPGPLAALGYAQRYAHGTPKTTDDVMHELREGEE